MCEWLKQAVLKTAVRETAPGVRIPLPPHYDRGCDGAASRPASALGRRRAVARDADFRGQSAMTPSFRRTFLILLVVVISLAFLWMISTFLVTILLAALFSSVAYGLHRQLVRGLGGREKAAAILTLVLLLALVVTPLLLVAGAVANQALRINETIGPRIAQLQQPGELDRWLRRTPGYKYVEPYREEIITRAGQLVGSLGGLVFNAFSSTTKATVLFFFHFVVMLYTMYFFLTDGPRLVQHDSGVPAALGRRQGAHAGEIRVRHEGDAQGHDTHRTRAGRPRRPRVPRGGHRGGDLLGYRDDRPVDHPRHRRRARVGAGRHHPRGDRLVLAGRGACALLLARHRQRGQLLRPILVGRDTRMHELMIFFSTLGGLLAFGAMGFVLGPVLAALFLTVWEMFGVAFRGELHDTESVVVTDQERHEPE